MEIGISKQLGFRDPEEQHGVMSAKEDPLEIPDARWISKGQDDLGDSRGSPGSKKGRRPSPDKVLKFKQRAAMSRNGSNEPKGYRVFCYSFPNLHFA